MLDQEDFDGLQYMMDKGALRTFLSKTDVDARIEAELVDMYADPVGYTSRLRKSSRKAFGHRGVKFLLRFHPAARGLSREDRDEIFALATGARSFSDTVGMSPEQKKKWHDRIQRWLPILKVIATFTPPPYNLGVIGFIVLLIWIDENRLKPAEQEVVALVCGVFQRAA